MFADLPAVVNRFQLRAASGRVYNEDLELVFAELPKFDKAEAELTTTLERWFYFLKHAGDLDAVPGSLQTEPAIVQAFEIANKAGLRREELDAQERREIFIQDQRGAILLAEQRGAEQERLRIAQTMLDIMLDMTTDDAVIAAKTNLSITTIRTLRQQSAGSDEDAGS